jgi:N-acetyl-gamma-glutamyl-phosphate reductase
MTLQIGIVGATGYTGSELVRLLHFHPHARIAAITSESHRGKHFSDIHPQFSGIVEQILIPVAELSAVDLDAVFLALPHGVSMDFAARFLDAGLPVIDFSGDFRLNGPDVYRDWYQKEHTYAAGFERAVYGLPELHRSAIAKADLIANPGCYPTSAILALMPLVRERLIRTDSIVIDSKSGVTGAGVKAKPVTHFSNVSDNFKAYGLKTHRHTIEIEEQLSAQGKEQLQVQFTPHLLPLDRGILTTAYLLPSPGTSPAQLEDAFQEAYRDEPFIRLRNDPPSLKDVRGSNYCDIYTTYDARTGRLIVISVIDNLVKGAAGQAMQNMNLRFGLEETAGFVQLPLHP